MAELRITKATVALAATLAILALGWAFSGKAFAGQEITEFNTEVSSTQAGGHPDVSYSISWTERAGSNLPCNCEDARVLDMHFPTGFIGNPHSVPTCSLAEFSLQSCPPETQVGVVGLLGGQLREALFNITPHPDEPGLVGFYVPAAETVIFVTLHARTESDYGLDTTTSAIYHFLPVENATIKIWGVPADPIHNAARFPIGEPYGVECDPYPGGCYGPVPSTAPIAPYLQNPTTCGVPLIASHTVQYYTGFVVTAEDDWPATTGCDQLTFNPSLTMTPTTTAADSMSGLDVTLKVPQSQSPTAPSPSEIRQVTLALPQGFTLAPNAANGKVACADSELSFDSEDAAHCPEFAKIGTSTIDSSALPGPIDGSVYIGQPLPGQTYRVFVTADGFATHVKLKGTVSLDPQTGQVTTTFADLPQSPIQEVGLHFFGSERGIFATPEKCGTYTAQTTFKPWDNVLPDQTSANDIVIDSGPGGTPCPGATRPFAPSVSAGSADNTAGRFSPFTLEQTRADGEQQTLSVTVKTPPGFLASLRGVSYCPESTIAALKAGAYTGRQELASRSCPASSYLGSIKTGAGAGTRPVYVPGEVYLAGPYRGAPVSLVTVTEAVSGPYDLGNVVVRAAVYLDPRTGELTTVTDPLPQILEGVPLRTRSLQIRFDRPNFTLNPTNCDPFTVRTTVFGDEGGVDTVGSHYQVANCLSMPFGPTTSLTLSNGLQARGHPAIHAVFKTAPGESNAKQVTVTLPNGEQLDNAHIGAVCTRPQFAADSCPANSLVGRAEVATPLLDNPLSGPVYLRASSHRLPDLAMDLEGQVNLELIGRVDGVNGRLRTTFEDVPDAPVDSVTFDLLGGSKGLLINSESLCARTKRASVRAIGQNGTVVNTHPKLRTTCGAARHKRSKRHAAGKES
jgi:hypothetical protein